MQSQDPKALDRSLPLFVDLDGTLIRTDLFLESAIGFVARNPLNVFRILGWLIRGRAVAKTLLAKHVRIDPTTLPYNLELLDYLRKERSLGRRMYLATASHKVQAERVASHLKIFEAVLATDAHNNLKGAKKLDRIRSTVTNTQFSYAGDSVADRPIWRAATGRIFVSAPDLDVQESNKNGTTERIILNQTSFIKSWLRGMRLHQWAKNALVLVPLLTSHTYSSADAVLASLLAFLCFGLTASGVYFLNDLVDLHADRSHPTKRFRPFAAGDLPIAAGIAGAVVMPMLAFVVANLSLPTNFTLALLSYFLITIAYSFWIKRIAMADIIALAVLYTMRIVAGAAAIDVALSSWLLAFSVFLFVSLAFLKRYVEIVDSNESDPQIAGRGYHRVDAAIILNLGTATAVASILILALFITSDEVRLVYRSPTALWGLCLIFLYWNSHLWLAAGRGQVTSDPVDFAVRDKTSRFLGAAAVATVFASHLIG